MKFVVVPSHTINNHSFSMGIFISLLNTCMRRLATFDLDEQGLHRLYQWDLDHPAHWIRILSVINMRWRDRYLVMLECTEAEELWLNLCL